MGMKDYWEGYEAPTQMQQDRLQHLIQNHPKHARALRESGQLEAYLREFQEKADQEMQDLLRCTPTSVGWAYTMAGATQELRKTDPAKWIRRSESAIGYARERVYRTMLMAEP